jgi:hypothetical protein
MIKLQRSVVRGIRAAKDRSELYYYLQKAVELEHSTIPPYLTALFSLMPGYNDEIRNLIHSIVVQEMLHMTIDANILIAIGGHPQINSAGFVPQYPGPLPMSDRRQGFHRRHRSVFKAAGAQHLHGDRGARTSHSG